MQPYIFPYVGYFHLILSGDRFVLLDNVNFIKKGWINRNRLIVNNQEYTFTIPLTKASQNRLINDIQVSEDAIWRQKLIKSIEIAYKNSPSFSDVMPLVENTLLFQGSIAQMAQLSIQTVLDYADLKHDISLSSDLNTGEKRGQDRIIEICKQMGATEYVNASGGKNLYDAQNFADSDLKLGFISSELGHYGPEESHFLPGLSIIDLMMKTNKSELKNLMSTYTVTFVS